MQADIDVSIPLVSYTSKLSRARMCYSATATLQWMVRKTQKTHIQVHAIDMQASHVDNVKEGRTTNCLHEMRRQGRSCSRWCCHPRALHEEKSPHQQQQTQWHCCTTEKKAHRHRASTFCWLPSMRSSMRGVLQTPDQINPQCVP